MEGGRAVFQVYVYACVIMSMFVFLCPCLFVEPCGEGGVWAGRGVRSLVALYVCADVHVHVHVYSEELTRVHNFQTPTANGT